jgi:uncharacterized protein (TIGR02996 family)
VLDAAALDPIEHQLVSAIAGGDDACRVVYADWLEERGEIARAGFLRAQAIVARAGVRVSARAAASQVLEQLAPDLDLAWRLAVRRPGIAHCSAFGFRCERAWSSLSPTRQAMLRQCGACDRRVRCCRTDDEIRHYSRRGVHVALDDVAPTAPDDAHALPAQLRYLEDLTPADAPPIAMTPDGSAGGVRLPDVRPADVLAYLRELLDRL